MIVNVVIQNVQATRFMQSAGIFENFKVLIFTPALVLEVKSGSLQEIRERLDRNGSLKVVAIWADGQSGGWRDPEVKVVGDGKSFGFLDNVLKQLGCMEEAVV